MSSVKKEGVVTRAVYDKAIGTIQTLVKDKKMNQATGDYLIKTYANDHRVKGTRQETHWILISGMPFAEKLTASIGASIDELNKLLKQNNVKLSKRGSTKKGLPVVDIKVEITA